MAGARQQGDRRSDHSHQLDIFLVPKWTDDEIKFAKEVQKSVGAKEVGLATQASPLRSDTQNTSSNDIGDYTWNVPMGSLRFASAIPGVQAHHWTAGIAPTTSIAHKGAVVGAKVMAASSSICLPRRSCALRQKSSSSSIPRRSNIFLCCRLAPSRRLT